MSGETLDGYMAGMTKLRALRYQQQCTNFPASETVNDNLMALCVF